MKGKIAVVGTGNVGMAYVYSMVNSGVASEIVLIDINEASAEANARDIADGNIFYPRKVNIYAGQYSDITDAELVCITAGAVQKPGESRMELLSRNRSIMTSIANSIMKTAFDGIILIAANPVDVMTSLFAEVSNYDKTKIIGSGTNLDSARFRQNISNYLNVNPKYIHGMIIGEHGDSSVPLYSVTTVGPKPILDYIIENPNYDLAGLTHCYEDARDAAYKIIEGKGSTYFGIGASLKEITKAVLDDQKVILPLTVYNDNVYDIDNIYIPLPALIGEDGVEEVIKLNLTPDEFDKLKISANLLASKLK